MASAGYHEPIESLTEETLNMHRAIVSLMEEWEAIDWYRQRADAASDLPLKEVLVHNKQEEIEHAAMLLEWIRRHDPQVDKMLRRYLFSDDTITSIEKTAEAATEGPPATLGIGDMKTKD